MSNPDLLEQLLATLTKKYEDAVALGAPRERSDMVFMRKVLIFLNSDADVYRKYLLTTLVLELMSGIHICVYDPDGETIAGETDDDDEEYTRITTQLNPFTQRMDHSLIRTYEKVSLRSPLVYYLRTKEMKNDVDFFFF